MKILDLYCKAGGAGMGLHQAFPDAEIVGVDMALPRYMSPSISMVQTEYEKYEMAILKSL